MSGDKNPHTEVEEMQRGAMTNKEAVCMLGQDPDRIQRDAQLFMEVLSEIQNGQIGPSIETSMSSCVNIMCVNNTAKVLSPCRISGLLSKPPIFSPKICQSQRSRNMRIRSSQDCLRKVFSMASGLPQLSATASSKLQLRGGAKMWHFTYSKSI